MHFSFFSQTPLNAILGVTDVLLGGASGGQQLSSIELNALAQAVQHSASLLLHTVDQILDYTAVQVFFEICSVCYL